VTQRIQRGWHDERASQIVEFAVSLPLLIVFVVGIFDFSGAFSLKHKLANAAREGVRAAAAGPSNDLVGYSTAVPASVGDALQVVDNYLQNAKVDDCGLSSASGSPSGTLTWKYTSSCAGGTTLTLTINRGYYFPQNSTLPTTTCTPQAPNSQTTIIATCVSIQYPYSWRFNRVITLLGATSNVPSSLTTVAVALNEN
jgi:Flp pilus assembly protein TadG